MIPQLRPRQSQAETERILKHYAVDLEECALLGVRGYYRDTMGKPTANDRGIYDDAIFFLSPEAFIAFNANTDPSAQYRTGLASLVAGHVYLYKVGTHGLSKPADRRYTALVQADQVLVRRDGKGLDRGWFGINIHKGSNSTTSSLGCQTIPPDQWPSFITLVRDQLKRFKQTEIPYLLIENEG